MCFPDPSLGLHKTWVTSYPIFCCLVVDIRLLTFEPTLNQFIIKYRSVDRWFESFRKLPRELSFLPWKFYMHHRRFSTPVFVPLRALCLYGTLKIINLKLKDIHSFQKRNILKFNKLIFHIVILNVIEQNLWRTRAINSVIFTSQTFSHSWNTWPHNFMCVAKVFFPYVLAYNLKGPNRATKIVEIYLVTL